jgi:large subunit ribosomal protein L17
MRNKKKGKKLGRNTDQRKALFRNLLSSLFEHEEIQTTESKAKVIKRLTDRLISKAKVGSLHVRRQILSFLPNKKAVNKLVDDIAPRFKNKISGYTKLTRLGQRRGDNALMVKLELIEKKASKQNSEKTHKKQKKTSKK